MRGQLTFPYGYGVVLTGITRHQFSSSGLDDVLLPHLVICKDEVTESADAEAFPSRLWDMFNVRFASKFTLPQVERIHQSHLPIDAADQASVTATPADLPRLGAGTGIFVHMEQFVG